MIYFKNCCFDLDSGCFITGIALFSAVLYKK